MLIACFCAASALFVAAAACGWPVGGPGPLDDGPPPSGHPARDALDAGLRAWLSARKEARHGRARR
jgi:hypothetical protein